MCIRDRHGQVRLVGLVPVQLAMLNERIGIFCDDTRDAIKRCV